MIPKLLDNQQPRLNLTKESKVKEIKYEVREAVFLTSKQTENLINKCGEAGANEWFETLSLHMLSTGKKYDSHYHTILNWIRRRELERQPKGQSGNGHKREPGPGGILNRADPDKFIKGKFAHMVQR